MDGRVSVPVNQVVDPLTPKVRETVEFMLRNGNMTENAIRQALGVGGSTVQKAKEYISGL